MEVRAFDHTLPGPSDRVDNVEYFQCNILNDDFSSELEGCCAVISALGIGFRPSTAIDPPPLRSEEHTSELQSLMRISYAVFCLKKTPIPHILPSPTTPTIHETSRTFY